MSHVCEETYDVYCETPRKARTPKPCRACKRTIAAGELYMHVTWVFDGRADGTNRCGACQATHEHLRHLDHYGEMWPDEELNCGLRYREEWGSEPPVEIAALPFLSGAEASAKLADKYASRLRAAAETRKAHRARERDR